MLVLPRRTDDFTGTLSAFWVRRNGSTNPLTSSGRLTCNTTNGFYPAEYIARATPTRDQYVAVTLAQLAAGTAGGAASGLMLRCPNSSSPGTVVLAYFTNRQMGIATMTGWTGGGFTWRADAVNYNGGADAEVGSRIEFLVVDDVFRTFVNGVQINAWDDTGNIANQNARYGGALIQRGNDGTATGQMAFDDFAFGPPHPINIPMPQQAVGRAGFY
ncbi:hypothetical protein [Nocardia otitidiscaviarum]|uniref:hypothetical protein n=1 Tax=Nocardia otitidiscaviarum TaxID=1823 RepID=UPI0004A7084B|nr:hypothetical protein [Nocardia otitidiscaviarum]